MEPTKPAAPAPHIPAVLLVFFIKTLSGTSSKTGKAYSIPMAQCLATFPPVNGAPPEQLVGEVMLADSLKETKPGHYLAVMDLGQYMGKIAPRIVGLTPCAAPRF